MSTHRWGTFLSPHPLHTVRTAGIVVVLGIAMGLMGRSPVTAHIYVGPYAVPGTGYGYDPNAGQVMIAGSSPPAIVVNGTQPVVAPSSITVNAAQPVATDAYGNPVTTTTTTTVPGATPSSPMTTYVQENTTVPPPNIDGIPYVVAGAESWVSPGGSYCTVSGGGQVWIPGWRVACDFRLLVAHGAARCTILLYVVLHKLSPTGDTIRSNRASLPETSSWRL